MASIKASVQGQERIKTARYEKGWTIEDTRWLVEASLVLEPNTNWDSEDYVDRQIFAAGVSLSTWKRFLQGKPINAVVFKAFCQVIGLNWESVAQTPEPTATSVQLRQDWGEAPEVSVFFGRTIELATLEQWLIYERCRLVAIVGMCGIGKTRLSVKLGMGGVGKTDLSLKLARGIQDKFEYVIWRSLLNAPPVTDILADCIKFLSNQQETNLPDTVECRIARLLHYLRAHRCLLILDNVETILQGGERAGQYRDGYEGYGQLFKQIGEVNHQSCLLLTSREKPQEIAQIEGKNRPVRSLELKGLDELEGQKIFLEIGDFSGCDEQWREVIEFYNGNPLALELAAKHIDEVFFGSISEFLRVGKPVFGDLRELLDWHFERLSEQEKEVMYWLAINREPMFLAELREDIVSPLNQEKLPSTLQSLKRRIPLERSGDRIALQPVLIEYVTERFIERVCEEIKTINVQCFNAHALLKALAKDYVRETQRRLILKSILDRLIATCGNSQIIENKLIQIITKAREIYPLKNGYLAGNILNTLCLIKTESGILKTTLKDYDFSCLTIWQAYLQGVNLHQVNFAYSKIDKSVFTQTLGMIFAVTLSPDGNLIATAMNNEICLWQMADSKQLFIYKGHTAWVIAVAFSPNGQLLASGSDDQTIKLWDIHTGQCLQTLQAHTSRIESVVFSPDSQVLASGSNDKTVKLWDVRTGQCLKILQVKNSRVQSVIFSSNGQTLVSSSDDGTTQIWDIYTGQCLNILETHVNWRLSVALSPDGQTLATGSDGNTIKLWNIYTGECLKTLERYQNFAWTVSFNRDGEILVTGSEDHTVQLWNLSTGECLKTLQGHTDRVWTVAFGAEDTILVSGCENQTLKLWDVRTGQCLKTLETHSNWVSSIAFSPDGQTLASGHQDYLVRLWNVDTGQCYSLLEGHKNWVPFVAFSPEGQILASASDDNTIKLWDVRTGKCLKTLQGHKNWVTSVAFSPKGQTVASSSYDQTVKLWDVLTGECLQTLRGHQHRVKSVTFNQDGQLLATGSDDNTVKLWNVHTGECLKTLAGHKDWVLSVAFSPCRNALATGSGDKYIKLWDIYTGECLQTLQGHTQRIRSVAFCPDGQTLASGSEDQTIKLWNTRTGQWLQMLQGHQQAIWSVGFSPDGGTLASASEDETIKVWDIQTGKCTKTLRASRPYEGMNITGVKGLTSAQKATLEALGAVNTKIPDFSKKPGI
jgi:WD40 repeat protein